MISKIKSNYVASKGLCAFYEHILGLGGGGHRQTSLPTTRYSKWIKHRLILTQLVQQSLTQRANDPILELWDNIGGKPVVETSLTLSFLPQYQC